MKYKLSVLFSALIMALTGKAQEPKLSGRFLGLKLSGGNNFEIWANTFDGASPSFNNSESHTVSTELGYGWFYKNKRSLYIGALVGISNNSSSSSKQWGNSFGISVQRASYKNLYQDKLWFSLTQEFNYNYAATRNYAYTSRRLPNPYVLTHSVDFALKPGILYRHSASFAFITQLNLIGAQLSMDDFSNGSNYVRFNYNIFSNYTVATLKVGVIWFPAAFQAKN
ncbi:MAG: hypothetical protein V4658_07320 [Bacteroidota bacterium]